MATLVCLAGIRMHRPSLRSGMYLGNCSCIALPPASMQSYFPVGKKSAPDGALELLQLYGFAQRL